MIYGIINHYSINFLQDDNYWDINLTDFGANIADFESNKISQISDQINLNSDQNYTENGANWGLL